MALSNTEFRELTPAVSPDGQWLAYSSDESGQAEIYVRPFPNTEDGKWLVSTAGGINPLWAPDGRELFYTAQGNLMSATVLPGSTFVTGARQLLFSLDGFRLDVFHPQYDVSPDGERFVMIRHRGAETAGELVLVQNFFEELKAKVGN